MSTHDLDDSDDMDAGVFRYREWRGKTSGAWLMWRETYWRLYVCRCCNLSF